MLLLGKFCFFIVTKDKCIIFNYRFSSKESACQAICHLHGSEMQGQIIKCSWGRDESINERSNTTNYGNNNNNMNNQNYNNNNQYDSVCLNKIFFYLILIFLINLVFSKFLWSTIE